MKVFMSFAFGIISWPILEYVLHRYLGHIFKINTLFKKEHTRHHVETNYFAPLHYKLIASIPICTTSFLTIGLATSSWALGGAFTFGFIGMYSFYEWAHWSFHAKGPKTNLGMTLRKHHFAHHFHNPKMNHGVTTRLIDKLAGTFQPVEVVKVPKNIALPWLFEDDKSTISAKYAKDFQIR
jgi:sterol desaturase/sphingolipid hydroxylase (fatty acid hydroxylase superfamily)